MGMGINQIFVTFTVLISLLTLPLSYAESNPESFLQCLEDNSDPSSNIEGVVSAPNSASYPTVLQSYIRNLRFNTSTTPKPLVIITATHESHVKASIVCSKKLSVQMKIRSGGHDYEGISYVSLPGQPFFILDMNMMRKVEVDISTETAWAEAGATLGEVYYYISNASRTHGFPAGVCPTVGVGGHFSGGGYGNMMRKYGLSVDNIIDAKMVDVNGTILDRKAMGEDLFWAIRGGGGASFGVVLAYRVRIVPVPEIVTVFNVARTLSQNATEIVYKWELVAPKLDEDLFIRLIMDVVNDTNSGEKTIRASFFALFLGDSDRLLRIMKEDFPELGLAKSDCLEMSWAQSVIYYTGFPQGTPNEALLSRIPQVLTHLKRKSDYVKEPIPKEGLEYIWKRMIELETPVLTFNPYGGKMAEIPASDTPFPHRAGNLWKIQYATNWNVDGDEAAQHYIELTRKLYEYMTPFVSKNPREAFLNYRDLDLGINHNQGVEESYEEGKAYGIKYFKGNFNRLVAIKTKVDPHNFFRNEQSVPILPY